MKENNSGITSTITLPNGATAHNLTYYQPSPAMIASRSQVIWNNRDFASNTAMASDGSSSTGTIWPIARGMAWLL